MRAHAQTPCVFEPVMPAAPAGKHAKPGEVAGEEFDYSHPFEVDLGRAAIIAEVLREFGYRPCTADTVTAELAKPDGKRSSIGRFAADALARVGWRP